METNTDTILESLISDFHATNLTDENKQDREQDTEHLLGIFPEMVWLCVAKHIMNTNTALDFFHSSTFFQNLLKPIRAQYLFPNVWTILRNQWEPFYGELPDQSFLDTVQKCRLVCKSWCNGIDSLPDNDKKRYILTRDPNPFRKPDYEFECYDFETFPTVFESRNPEYMETFKEHFELTHGIKNANRNPFPQRRVVIDYNSADYHFFVNLSEILSKYGHHVKHSRLHGCTCTLTAEAITYYVQTKQILQLMPNLEGLECLNGNPDGWESKKLNPELERIISERPIPLLYHLKFLSLENVPESIFKEIMRQAVNLKMLRIESQNVKNMLTLSMPKLEKLFAHVKSVEEFLVIGKMKFKWPVNTLHLHIDFCHVQKLAPLFNLLESKWSKSLTSLTLQFQTTGDMKTQEQFAQDCSTLRLNLPLVKSLSLDMHSVHSIDFILPMKENLEYLRVNVLWNILDYRLSALSLVAQYHQIIQFLGYFEKRKKNCKTNLESNVWTLFPKLKQFDIWDGGDRISYQRTESCQVCFTPVGESYCGSNRKAWKASMQMI